jgi:hypothetical protein
VEVDVIGDAGDGDGDGSESLDSDAGARTDAHAGASAQLFSPVRDYRHRLRSRTGPQ